MSFNFKCSPMYNQNNNQVVGYMCDSEEQNVEGFVNSESKSVAFSMPKTSPSISPMVSPRTQNINKVLSNLNNYKSMLSSIKNDISKFINEHSSQSNFRINSEK